MFLKVCAGLVFALLCAQPPIMAQETGQKPTERVTLASGVERMVETESTSHIQYVRLLLKGALLPPPVKDDAAAQSPPLLIAQCTLRPNGRNLFEMFMTFGEAVDLAFYPPWVPSSAQDLFPPRTQKVTMTMEFLGYTHVKPLRRQWEIPANVPGMYRFNSPGRDSSNMEEVAYDLRYLLALPTMRLTLEKRSAEFMTTPLLDEIRREPLCRAAGI